MSKGNLDLSYLSANLYELGIAALKNPQSPKCVSNWACTTIYAEGIGLGGKFWSWVYWLAECLGFKDLKKEKLTLATYKTRDAFQSYKKNALEIQGKYFLTAFLEPEEGSLRKVRTVLAEWHVATSLFVKFMDTRGSQGIQEMLKYNSCLPFLTEIDKMELKSLRRFHKVIVLEAHLLQAIPLSLIKKAACSEELFKPEKEQLRAFVKAIDSSGISVRIVDGALKALVEGFQSNELTRHADLVALRVALIYHGAEFFDLSDVKFNQWTSSLKTGDKIHTKKQEYLLGEQLENGSTSEDIVFVLENNPSVKVFFYKNKVLSEMREWVNQFSWGIKSACCTDTGKGFVVLEPLENSLSSIQWSSQGDEISQEDLNFAVPITKMYEWFLGDETFPEGFSHSSLMFNSQGVLTSLKLVSKGKVIDFLAYVQHARECSKGNRTVYKFIVKPFLAHIHAMLFNTIVENCMSLEPVDFETIVRDYRVDSEMILDAAKKLQEDLQKLKDKLLMEYSFEKVSKAISGCYKEECYIGILPENFEELVKALL